MKTKLLSLFFTFSIYALAQNPIPNPGFESWTSGNPTAWSTNNLASIATPVLQSSSAHGGTSAARLEIVNAFGQAFPPVLTILNPVVINQSYASFSFYYKCSLSSDDGLAIDVNLKNGGNSVAVATGTLDNSNNTNVYTQKTIAFQYFGSSPNAFDISFILGSSPNSSTMTIGSYVLIDDLSFGAPVGIKEISDEEVFSLGSPSPNPMQNEGRIPFVLNKKSLVCLELYSLDGKKVMHILQSELMAGCYKAELNVSALNSGVYLCKLSSDGRSVYSKIIVD